MLQKNTQKIFNYYFTIAECSKKTEQTQIYKKTIIYDESLNYNNIIMLIMLYVSNNSMTQS